MRRSLRLGGGEGHVPQPALGLGLRLVQEAQEHLRSSETLCANWQNGPSSCEFVLTLEVIRTVFLSVPGGSFTLQTSFSGNPLNNLERNPLDLEAIHRKTLVNNSPETSNPWLTSSNGGIGRIPANSFTFPLVIRKFFQGYLPFPFFSGILLFEKPPKTLGKQHLPNVGPTPRSSSLGG